MPKDFKSTLIEYSRSLTKELSIIMEDNKQIISDAQITVYNVFDYAWDAWQQYISTFANQQAQILLLGINPGPHGMVQTGIPFGNISTVRDWLNLTPHIDTPKTLHPSRPVVGLEYHKEEPSGKLLWNTICSLYQTPQSFFTQCMVLNYCPLAFFAHNGENLTPDKIPIVVRTQIEQACTQHLYNYIRLFEFTTVLAIGKYSEKKTRQLLNTNEFQNNINIIYITHPSPLNPKHKLFPQEFASAVGKQIS